MKLSNPESAISDYDAESISVRGLDLCADLIGNVNFADFFLLLLTGKQPTPMASRVLNATLVAIAEHGMTPSIQAARMTFAAAPDALQGAVAAGILGCGSVILGASEVAGRLFAQIDAQMREQKISVDQASLEAVQRLHAERKPIPGYGHPFHKIDPRVSRLFDVAAEAGAPHRFVDIARAVEAAIPDVLGKDLRLNVSAAIPAVLLDAGFPLEAIKGVPILARVASLIAHLMEEKVRPIGFTLARIAGQAVTYSESPQ